MLGEVIDIRGFVPSPNLRANMSEFSELRKLLAHNSIEIVCGCEFMTDEETAQAMLDILAETALKPVLHGTSMKADITSRLTAVERWLDRKKGKPVGTSPLVQIANAGDLNVMIRLVDAAGNVEMIEG